jgi:hypothetical protein
VEALAERGHITRGGIGRPVSNPALIAPISAFGGKADMAIAMGGPRHMAIAMGSPASGVISDNGIHLPSGASPIALICPYRSRTPEMKKKLVIGNRLRGRPHHEKDRYRCRDRNLVRTVGHAC